MVSGRLRRRRGVARRSQPNGSSRARRDSFQPHRSMTLLRATKTPEQGEPAGVSAHRTSASSVRRVGEIDRFLGPLLFQDRRLRPLATPPRLRENRSTGGGLAVGGGLAALRTRRSNGFAHVLLLDPATAAFAYFGQGVPREYLVRRQLKLRVL